MSYSFDGANDNMRGQFATTYNSTPITLACYIKIAAHPVAADCFINFGESSVSVDHALILRTDTVDDGWVALTDAGATGAGATLSSINLDSGSIGTTYNATTGWAGLVGVFTNDALRDVYAGAIGNTAQNTGNQVANDTLTFICLGENITGSQDFTGLMAEVAIWNAALNSSEITSYLGGLKATQIAPANLIGYWPLSASNATQSNEGVDTDGDLAVTGATFDADHPTISLGSVKSSKKRMMLGLG